MRPAEEPLPPESKEVIGLPLFPGNTRNVNHDEEWHRQERDARNLDRRADAAKNAGDTEAEKSLRRSAERVRKARGD